MGGRYDATPSRTITSATGGLTTACSLSRKPGAVQGLLDFCWKVIDDATAQGLEALDRRPCVPDGWHSSGAHAAGAEEGVMMENIAKPLFAGHGGRDGVEFRGEGLYGTAFPIGGKRFLTAAHVLSGIQAAQGRPFLGWPQVGRRLQHRDRLLVTSAETKWEWPHVDLAVIEVPGADDHDAGAWASDVTDPMLTRVSAFGYPYGYRADVKELTMRAFSGTIVSSRSFDRLAGTFVYELSFGAPRGLSGSGLLLETGIVAGCVVGNELSRIMVFSDEERIEEPAGVTRIERYEALHLGIAVQSGVILRCELEPGKTTIADWIQQHNGAVTRV